VNKIQSTVKAHYKTAVLASYENSSLSIRLVRTTEIDDIKTEKKYLLTFLKIFFY